MRRDAKVVKIGEVAIGGRHSIPVQSMLNVPADNLEGNVRQARVLEAAGCEILRVSVPALTDVRLVDAIKTAVSVPLVADIHFDCEIAIACAKAGADKIRINPGNIGEESKVRQLAQVCYNRKIPIRVGVNAGSLNKEILAKYGGPTAEALVESAVNHVRLLEKYDFGDIVVSIKSHDVLTNISAYRLLARQCVYPLHLGVTEAGAIRAGLVKNALGIGVLLMEGIGDTLRVSLTGEKADEVAAGYDILRAVGLPARGVEMVSCPTCGRTCIPVAQIAAEAERRLAGRRTPLKVAVMGCVVNGLGEGKGADIGIAGGKDSAVLFVKGRQVRTVRGADPAAYVQALIEEIDKMADTPL